MTKEKLIQAVAVTRRALQEIPFDVPPVVQSCRTSLFDHEMSTSERVGHMLWMCDRIDHDFIPGDDLGKAFRWLGFIQGALWAKNRCTIQEMANTNR